MLTQLTMFLRVEYIALTSSFFLVAFEAVIRIFTLALRSFRSPPSYFWFYLLTNGYLAESLIGVFYRVSKSLVNRFTSPAQKQAEERKRCLRPLSQPSTDTFIF